MMPGAGYVQRIETKQAFFAGAKTVLMALLSTVADEMSEEQSEIQLRDIHLECDQVINDIIMEKSNSGHYKTNTTH